jgi:hypothetical protein
VDIESVHPWTKANSGVDNPKKLGPADVKALAALIDANGGFRSPLTVWGKNRVIYKGNGSHAAAKALGYKKVPVTFQSFPSVQAAVAYGLADNESGLLRGYDKDILKEIMTSQGMEELTGGDKNKARAITGFTERKLSAILKYGEDDEENKVADIVSGKKDFLVIEFQKDDDIKSFRDRMGISPSQRVFTFSQLNDKMGFYE